MAPLPALDPLLNTRTSTSGQMKFKKYFQRLLFYTTGLDKLGAFLCPLE